MDMISAIVLLSLAAVPLAVLAGWFVGPGYSGLGSLVNRGDSDAWWRATMPLPQGIQEEDQVGWHVRDRDLAVVGSSARGPATREVMADDFEIAPVHPQTRVGFRPPPPERGSPR